MLDWNFEQELSVMYFQLDIDIHKCAYKDLTHHQPSWIVPPDAWQEFLIWPLRMPDHGNQQANATLKNEFYMFCKLKVKKAFTEKPIS